MSRMSLRRSVITAGLTSAAALMMMALVGCTGDTDGGSSAQEAERGNQFVGAGGKLDIEIEADNNTISVGDQVGFFVTATDNSGRPLSFIRLFCESEKGLAIIEPSSGGVAFEHTGADGRMSGRLGGVTPGSYLLECRAPQGFNLVDRVTVKINGPVPLGFQGFPGAAGGNLGGGRLIEQTPPPDGGTGFRIAAIRVTDAGGTNSTGPLDVTQEICVNNAGLCSQTCTAEPFTFSTYAIYLINDTEFTAFIDSITIELDGTTTLTTEGQAVEVAKGGGQATITGVLTTAVGCPGTSSPESDICFNSGDSGANAANEPVVPGTNNFLVTVRGQTESGESFTIEKEVAIQFDYVNNCAEGFPSDSCPAIPAALYLDNNHYYDHVGVVTDIRRIEELRRLLGENPGADVFYELAEKLSETPTGRAEARDVIFRGLAKNPRNAKARLLLAKLFYQDQMLEFCVRELIELHRYTDVPAVRKLLEAFGEYAQQFSSDPVADLPSKEIRRLERHEPAKETVMGELDIDAELFDALEEEN